MHRYFSFSSVTKAKGRAQEKAGVLSLGHHPAPPTPLGSGRPGKSRGEVAKSLARRWCFGDETHLGQDV